MVASVVIPNWNGKELLKVSLPSIQKQSLKNFEVIIVDNGSTDGSVEYIKKNFPDFKVIQLEKNIGFSPAVNIGIKVAKGDYVILINNDTKVEREALFYLVKAAKDHPGVGMVAAKMIQFYNPKLLDSAGDYIEVVGHADNIGRDQPIESFNNPGFIFLVTGGGGLFKRQMLDKIGLLNDDYFAYFEDVDLSLRAQLAGYKAWFEPKAVIYHRHKATSNRNKPFTEYLQFRNMTMTIIRDFPSALMKKDFNWIKIILVNLNTVLFLVKNGYGKEALQSEWYIIKNIHRLLKERQRIQSQKNVSDEYIIENFQPKKITFFGLLKKGI